MEGGGVYLAPDDLRSKVNSENLERPCSVCIHSEERGEEGIGGFPVIQGNGFCCFPSVLKLSAYVMYVCITEQDFSLAAKSLFHLLCVQSKAGRCLIVT